MRAFSRPNPSRKIAPQFNISPEKEASQLQYFYRQFFVKTEPLTQRDTNLNGKTAIITGSNTGLGLEAAQQLLDLGLSRIIMAVRSVSKAEAAREQLYRGRTPGCCEIEIWGLDLSSYESVIELGERAKELDRLDLVVLNAALYKITETFNPSTGYDEDIQVNYLSNALLMVLLLPILKESSRAHSGPGRVVLVSSDAAAWAQFDERTHRPILSAFKEENPDWRMQERYGTSKLLGQFFLTEIVRRVDSSMVTVDAVNPGFCYGSELSREGNGKFLGYLVKIFMRIVGKPSYMGARSIVHAAAGFGEEIHGQYVEDGLIRPMAPILYQPEGEEVRKRLWDETMAELSFAGAENILKQMSA